MKKLRSLQQACRRAWRRWGMRRVANRRMSAPYLPPRYRRDPNAAMLERIAMGALTGALWMLLTWLFAH